MSWGRFLFLFSFLPFCTFCPTEDTFLVNPQHPLYFYLLRVLVLCNLRYIVFIHVAFFLHGGSVPRQVPTLGLATCTCLPVHFSASDSPILPSVLRALFRSFSLSSRRALVLPAFFSFIFLPARELSVPRRQSLERFRRQAAPRHQAAGGLTPYELLSITEAREAPASHSGRR